MLLRKPVRAIRHSQQRLIRRSNFSNPLLVVLLAFVFLNAQGTLTKGSEPPPETLAGIAEAFRIKIVKTDPEFPVTTTFGLIDGEKADEKDIAIYSKLFTFEFSLYPPQLVHRTRLKRVVFCTGLSFAGQRRNAIPDFEHDTLYLDVSRGRNNRLYLRKVIHHEFFHIIDYRDDGKLYKDELWSSLNAVEFQYGTGGASAQDNRNTSVLTNQFPGFLNHYSTTGVEEDKAEVFAHLMAGTNDFEERASKDPVLNAKLEQMRTLLCEFCPEMDGVYWEKLRSVNRGDE